MSDDPEWELHPVDLAGHALKNLAAEPVSCMSRKQLRQRARTLQQFRQPLDASIAVTMAEADAAGVPLDSRQRTMAQVLGSDMNACPATVRADLRVGRFLRELPVLEDAVRDGRMSRDHVLHLQKGENIRVRHAMGRDQHLFVEWARDFAWSDFEKLFAEWLLVNDQDGPEPEDHDVENSVNIRTLPDGRVTGNFNLDPVTGETLKQQLGDEESALFNEQLAKDPCEQDFLSVLDPNSVDGRCELIDGTPIHPKYALVLAMQANLRRQVLGAKNVTVVRCAHYTSCSPRGSQHRIFEAAEILHNTRGFTPITVNPAASRAKQAWPTSTCCVLPTTNTKATAPNYANAPTATSKSIEMTSRRVPHHETSGRRPHFVDRFLPAQVQIVWED